MLCNTDRAWAEKRAGNGINTPFYSRHGSATLGSTSTAGLPVGTNMTRSKTHANDFNTGCRCGAIFNSLFG